MIQKLRLTFFLICTIAVGANAQRTIVNDHQTWLALFNQARFSKHWGVWHDAHLRLRDNFFDSLATGIVRVGLTYYINDDLRLTAGYSYVGFAPEGTRQITLPEHRPWQQIQWFVKYPKVRVMQWLRLEERFRQQVSNGTKLLDAYDFNYRIRHNAMLTVPLSKKGFSKGGFQFALANELHVNLGDAIVYNVFDQNRLFAGIIFQNTDHSNLQFGYMNVYQQLAVGNRHRNNHVIRVFYNHNFDFRKVDK
jgi:hypothetical protein